MGLSSNLGQFYLKLNEIISSKPEGSNCQVDSKTVHSSSGNWILVGLVKIPFWVKIEGSEFRRYSNKTKPCCRQSQPLRCCSRKCKGLHSLLSPNQPPLPFISRRNWRQFHTKRPDIAGLGDLMLRNHFWCAPSDWKLCLLCNVNFSSSGQSHQVMDAYLWHHKSLALCCETSQSRISWQNTNRPFFPPENIRFWSKICSESPANFWLPSHSARRSLTVFLVNKKEGNLRFFWLTWRCTIPQATSLSMDSSNSVVMFILLNSLFSEPSATSSRKKESGCDARWIWVPVTKQIGLSGSMHTPRNLNFQDQNSRKIREELTRRYWGVSSDCWVWVLDERLFQERKDMHTTFG